jgi:hypothetical protein
LVRLFSRQTPVPPKRHRSGAESAGGAPKALRLQGFTPRESPPPSAGCLDLHTARSSLELCALQGSIPSLACRGSHRSSPHDLWLYPVASDLVLLGLQGFIPNEIGSSLSRLPALLSFAAS